MSRLPAQEAELHWWKQEFDRRRSLEAYLRARHVGDLSDSSWPLQEIHCETGKGLDLCCGLVSVLEGLQPRPDREIWAVDALMDEYQQIYRSESPVLLHYEQGDGEQLRFEDSFFDWVWCCNAIDHTPHPERMVSEIQRVLKPEGRLYMWVNFDRPPLSACHYDLWHWGMVEQYFAPFHLIRATLAYSRTWRKYVYFGYYENQK